MVHTVWLLWPNQFMEFLDYIDRKLGQLEAGYKRDIIYTTDYDAFFWYDLTFNIVLTVYAAYWIVFIRHVPYRGQWMDAVIQTSDILQTTNEHQNVCPSIMQIFI